MWLALLNYVTVQYDQEEQGAHNSELKWKFLSES